MRVGRRLAGMAASASAALCVLVVLASATPPSAVHKISLASKPRPVAAGGVLTLRLRLHAVHARHSAQLKVAFLLRRDHHRDRSIGTAALRLPSQSARTVKVALKIAARTPPARYALLACAGKRGARVCLSLGRVRILAGSSGPPGGSGGTGGTGGSGGTGGTGGTGGSGGAPGGTGGSGPVPLCTPSPCTPGSLTTYSVAVDDGAGKTVTRSFQVERPTNLVNAPDHPVPLVITFFNNQKWVNESAAGQYVVAYIPPVHVINGGCCQYAAQAISPAPSTVGAQDCGLLQHGTCDDAPWVAAVVKALSCNGSAPCQNINPKRVYASGGSKGGTMTQDAMCDPRTSGLIRAYSTISNLMISPSSTNDQKAFPRCAALLGSNPNRNVSAMWIYGTADPNFHGPSCPYTNNCLGTGFTDTSNRWQFGDEQLATTVFGTHTLGCPTVPSTTVFGSTGGLTRRVYSPCNVGSGVATETIAVRGGGHIPEGADGLDIAKESWQFFTAHG